MRRISVLLRERSYPIVVGYDILRELGKELSPLGLASKLMIVTSRTVWDIYGQIVHDSLVENGFDPSVTLIDDDERNKSFQTLLTIFDNLVKKEFDRSSGVVALGGGVVGDTAGFAAATFMRGIEYVQVPTTLLAMVDSSIGGKTGVNHLNAKNLIGAFHQPKLVWSDISTLSTLSERELASGLAEIIKYSVIADPTLFQLLSHDIKDFSDIPRDTLIEIVSGCAAIKARIIAEDENERNIRSILNYGHTVGHALESLTGYTEYTHGEAVAIGMMAAARISLKIGTTNHAMVEAQESIIKRSGLSTTFPRVIDPVLLARQLTRDKKKRGDRVRWVLPKSVGEVFMTEDVPSEVVLSVLREMSNSLEIEADCR